MQIVYMTNPANLFHMLRRQIHRQFRKPLVIFFSKSLLRHPIARSSLDEFTGDSHFQWIIPDPGHGTAIDEPEKIERVILCSGQVYAALTKHREANNIRNTAITRVEQLHPFPWAQLKENLDSYPNARNVVWAQEEPLNAGSWSYVQPRIETLLNATEHHNRRHVLYAGRAPSASVASGLKSVHLKEEQEFLEDAFRPPGASEGRVDSRSRGVYVFILGDLFQKGAGSASTHFGFYCMTDFLCVRGFPFVLHLSWLRWALVSGVDPGNYILGWPVYLECVFLRICKISTRLV